MKNKMDILRVFLACATLNYLTLCLVLASQCERHVSQLRRPPALCETSRHKFRTVEPTASSLCVVHSLYLQNLV